MKVLFVCCVLVTIGVVYCSMCHNDDPSYCHDVVCTETGDYVGCHNNRCTCMQGALKCQTTADCTPTFSCKDEDKMPFCQSGWCHCHD